MLIYTDLVSKIIADVAAKVPDFSHLRPRSIATLAATRWAGTRWGDLASCMGLVRESGPTFSIWVRGRSKKVVEVSPWYRTEPVEILRDGEPCRYLILLRLPRFFESDPLETIVHELFHVAEAFDGSLRPMRHGKRFDLHVKRLTREWLKRADPELAKLARMRPAELRALHGTVVARRTPPWFQPSIRFAAEAPCEYAEGVRRYYSGYRLARNFGVAPIKLSHPKTPREIEVDECPLRVYHEAGSTDLPRARRPRSAVKAIRAQPRAVAPHSIVQPDLFGSEV